MDEDDNQEELIHRSASHSKGKRAALWVISDDSDDVEDESEEEESDSGEEEEKNHLDGEDEEEGGTEEEDDDDEEEVDDTKPEHGVLGGNSADLTGMSSDDDLEKCPICLNSFISQPVATPENCDHYFCLDCILAWSKNANSCPVDRIAFNSIYLRKCYGGKVKKIITVQTPVKERLEETIDLDLEQTNCAVCGGSDREDRLLLCDGCDAGYHMDCLTPPLDSVPVEEWFCPECEANNRHSRASAEEGGDAESLPSSAQPATSRHQPRVTGPTRAIARTQQSERVRARVNRHRITQARASQLAPTYLMQSTWLDETINAVVAGLNTAVYIRDLTPRVPTRRSRKTGRRKKRRSKNTSSANSKTGKSAATGVRRRKRRVRRTKSRKKLAKKAAGPRSRIASNLGIVKDKKSSSLPTVYRPSEHTLSSMRADIGAASLSIYGDPFDLDPFVDREEDEHQTHVTSLLEAKRRGISRSALRSHQPVARPVTASHSRRGMDVPHSDGVVEAAPVPDLLGSILSGQSMLLMDSSDIIINRDGSLKATKPMMPSTSEPCCSKSSSSGDTGLQGMSPILGESSLSPHYNADASGSSSNSINRALPQGPSQAQLVQRPLYSDLLPRSNPRLQPLCPNRPAPSPGDVGTSKVRASRETSLSVHTAPDLHIKNKDMAPSQSGTQKAPTKPTWVDVAVLPRIPKIRRESSGITNCGTSQGSSNRISSSKTGSSNSITSNGYGMSEAGMNSLAGDKSKQQSVDQQKGRADSQNQRHRPDGAGSSSSFSHSFSSSSSSGSFANQPQHSSSSSSSSAVSFRINSSGNSWHSRRLSMAPSSGSGSSTQQHFRGKEDQVRKRQLRRDKQMLLASRTLVKNEQDRNNIYDPFNPTLSDSSSDSETETSSQNKSSPHTTHEEEEAPCLGNRWDLVPNKKDMVHVKTEPPENEALQKEPGRVCAVDAPPQDGGYSHDNVKVEKESILVDVKYEKQLFDILVKKEPGSDDAQEAERCDQSINIYLKSETADSSPPAHQSQDFIKTDKESPEEKRVMSERNDNMANLKDSSTLCSASTKKKQASDSIASCSKSPSQDFGQKKTTKGSKERHSSSSEMDRGKRLDHHSSDQGSKQNEKKERERSSKRSRSRERRRARSASQSSRSNSPDRTVKKRKQSRSRSKDRRRSRSVSSSSSREHSRRKKHKKRSKEGNDGRERDRKRRHVSKDKRRGRSRSRSRSGSLSRLKDNKIARSPSKLRTKSQSRSRSRSREKKDHTQLQKPSLSYKDKMESQSKGKKRHKSRSSSRERAKDEGSSLKSSEKASRARVSSSNEKKQLQDKKKDKDNIHSSLKERNNAKDTGQVSSCWSSYEVKQEGKRLVAEKTKDIKVVKEIKQENRSSCDTFEDSLITSTVKKEEMDISFIPESKGIDKEEVEEDLSKARVCEIKSEAHEITIKSEPSSPKLCHFTPVTASSTLTTPATTDCQQNATSQSHLCVMASDEQLNVADFTAPVKQEVLLLSDSDDDLSVDVMLDNLDYVKSERTEGNSEFVKLEEKEVEEGKSALESVLAIVGAKSKSQGKRVTWNIQEPEGPPPEKSASKLALYKMKLKQEGLRRPSPVNQTSGQDITGAVCDSSKKSGGALPSTSSSSDPKVISVTEEEEAEESDVSRKDKYLKKLHMQERAIEEVKLAIKPFYQKRDINKDEYKEILRKAVQKVCHSKSGEINPVKVGNLVKAYVDKYKHARKHKKGENSGKAAQAQTKA